MRLTASTILWANNLSSTMLFHRAGVKKKKKKKKKKTQVLTE